MAARGAHRPLDRVRQRCGPHPAGNQAPCNQDRGEEQQRQADEVGDGDHRLLAPGEQGDPVREAGEPGADQPREAARITSQPSTPPFPAPSASPTSSTTSACSVETKPDWTIRAPDDRAPSRRRREEALDDAAVEILDRPHSRPGAGEERGHDRDPGRQVVDVRNSAEAVQIGDPAEELAVEQQPDHRLDEHEHDPDRLAREVPHHTQEEDERLADGGHLPASSSERNSRPV